MDRFLAISPKSQWWLFHVALALNVLGMLLTDMWLPMVVGAIVTTYLSVDATVRLHYILPIKKSVQNLERENALLRRKLDDIQQVTSY